MMYLIVSVASLVMMGAGLSVIVLTLRGNGAKIVAALAGHSTAGIAAPAYLYAPYRTRTPFRTPRSRPAPRPLRAAA